MKIKLLGLIILLAGGLGAWFLMHTAPVAETREKTRSARVVQTIELQPAARSISVSAYGTVVPARRLVVRPEVTGRIQSLHPALVPGGRIQAGETLFTIDDADYRIARREAQSAKEDAQAALSLEAGRRAVAEREYEQLRRDLPEADINRELVLREPFRRQAEAAFERATAAIARSELNLARTTVPSPFNALVIEETAELGQLAEPGTPLATLVGADAFWVQVSLPLREISAIQLPRDGTPGAQAKVHARGQSDDSTFRIGKVVRLLGDLDPAGRLARVLIEVPNPLEGEPLFLGSYVRVDIEAGTLPDAVEIPRHALREGDRIWIVGEANELIIREPHILWRNEESVYATNLFGPGESLIVSDLVAPLPGMALAPQPSASHEE